VQSQQLPMESQGFSRTRSAPATEELTNQPRKCRSDTIMARILAEKTESSFEPSPSFRRVDRPFGILREICLLTTPATLYRVG